VCNKAQNNDFIYFDSPYFPESVTADFTSYSKEGFGLKEHERLNRLYKELSSKGVKMMLSNNDVEWVRENYSEFRIIPIEAKRMVNRDGSKRNNGREVLILNY
jgi:DNA adenine methylase